MEKRTKQLYEFGEFCVDPAERTLRRRDQLVPLKAKVFDLLVLLLENTGRLLEKEWLLSQLWPQSFVEEVNLNVNISTLRKALGETPTKPQYIETVPKRGYRFVAPVTERTIDAAGPAAASLAEPERAGEIPAPRHAADASSAPAIPPAPSASPAADAVREKPSPRSFLWRYTFAAMVAAVAIASGVYLFLASRPSTKDENRRLVRTVAVLPFKTSGSDEINNALRLGMSDALITRLSHLRQVTVRPIGAVLKYADTDQDPVETGKVLGVDAVLTGFVQKDGKTIRISTQMLRVSDSATLWADKFDDFFTNVLAVQDAISEKMTEALALRLTHQEQQLMTRRDTEDTEAYQLYLVGRYYAETPPQELKKALDSFRAAIGKDPDFAPAYDGAAGAYYTMGEQGAMGRQEARARAVEAVNKALSLDPNLADAYGTRSVLKMSEDYDWAGAEEDARRAVEMTPNVPDIHSGYARLLTKLGRHEEAIAEAGRAVQLDPSSYLAQAAYCETLYFARRYERLLEEAERLAKLDPTASITYHLLGWAYVEASRFDDAIAEYNKDVDAQGKVRVTARLIHAYARGGRRDEARRLLEQYKQQIGKPGFSSNYCGMASCSAALGDKEQAFAALEKAYQAKEYPVLLLKVGPEWDSLRDDPRFTNLLQRLKLAP